MKTQRDIAFSILTLTWILLLAIHPHSSTAATVLLLDSAKAAPADESVLPDINPVAEVEAVVEDDSSSSSSLPAIAKEPTRAPASESTTVTTRQALKDSEKYLEMSFDDFILKLQSLDAKSLAQVEEELVLAEVVAGEKKNGTSIREINDRITNARNAVSLARQANDQSAETLALADLRMSELAKKKVEDLQRGGGYESKIRSFATLARAVSKSPESFEKDPCSVLLENSSVRSSLNKTQQESLCKNSPLKEKLFAKSESAPVASVRRSFASTETASPVAHTSESDRPSAPTQPVVNPANFQPQNFQEMIMQQMQTQQLQAGQMQMMRGQQIYESCMGEIANAMAIAPIRDVQKRIEPMISALRAKTGSSLHSELLAMIPDGAVSEMGVFGLDQDAANVVKSVPNSVEDNKSLREQLKIIEGINAATTRALEAVRSEMAGLPPPSTKEQMDEMRKLDAKRIELLKSQNAAMALIPAIRAELQQRKSLVDSAFRPLGQGGIVVPRVGAPK